jgi:serine/threonine protein phosphatase PrpC
VLTSVVGTKDDVKPGAREEQLVAGDRFVMCSDGVHGKLDSAALDQPVATRQSAAMAPRRCERSDHARHDGQRDGARHQRS